MQQDPLKYPTSLLVPAHRKLALVGNTISLLLSFATSVFTNGGKLRQTSKDKKNSEFRGLAAGTIFLTAGMLMNFFAEKPPDPNTELLKSINATVTATYDAVLRIQDELHTVANELASLGNQIATAFDALNTEILTAQCTSAFGTMQARLDDHTFFCKRHASCP